MSENRKIEWTDHTFNPCEGCQKVSRRSTSQQGAVKDHQIRETVNRVAELCLQFRDSQQLRERISRFLVPVLRGAQPHATDSNRRDALTYPAQFTDELQWILGLMCFQCIQYAQALRKGGREIPTKAEAEQATTLDFLLRQYMRDPKNWRKTAADELRAMAACNSGVMKGEAEK